MNKKIVFWSLGVLLFLLALAGGYYGYGYFLKKDDNISYQDITTDSNLDQDSDVINGILKCEDDPNDDEWCLLTLTTKEDKKYFLSGEEDLLTKAFNIYKDREVRLKGRIGAEHPERDGYFFEVEAFEKI